MIKALALISGGLDSILAAKIILEQGIEIVGISFFSIFYALEKEEFALHIYNSVEEQLGVNSKIWDISEELLEIVKTPKFGYGRNLNPCIDCRILMLKKAKEYMRQINASFLITGEVLNERPMSQKRKTLRVIDKEVGLEGYILRPLSAKLLEPTLVEKEGLVNREKLLAIQGRTRRIQLELAANFGLKKYFTPAGGCLLTDSIFAKKMLDLMQYSPNFALNDVELLKIGRHFRLCSKAKLIIGRNQKENEKIARLAEDEDICFYPQDLKGPFALGRGDFGLDLIELAGRILLAYDNNLSQKKKEIVYKKKTDNHAKTLICSRLSRKEVEHLKI